MGEAVPFPQTQPRGYEWLDGEPAFDPQRHLQMEEPAEVLMLADLGYDDAEIAAKATPVALSSPFRVLTGPRPTSPIATPTTRIATASLPDGTGATL